MSNIFTDLVAKLTRRQRKGKPVPVKPEPPLKAVTYNRVDGVVSGGLIQSGDVKVNHPPFQQVPRGVTWDDDAKVYRGTNYFVQAQKADKIERERRERLRRDYDDGDDFGLFVAGTTFDDTFFYQNAPESPSTGSESSGVYDGYTQTVSPAYEAPSPSYSAPETSYSPPSYTSDYGSSSSSSSYSSDSGDSSSSSSYSDSGSSGGGSYSD